MNREQLKHEIETRFPSKRAFVSSFNECVGFAALDETTLSRQLSEKNRIALSNAWKSAYTLFFQIVK